jgi:peptidoglycan hydrolase-like protein with peptidoglycan-binding domain
MQLVWLRQEQIMSGTSPWPVVQNGKQGHPVRTLQFLLRARGHHVTIDGVFGPATDTAVKAFQTSKGLTVEV